MLKAFLMWAYRHSRTMRNMFATREQYVDLAMQVSDITKAAMTALHEMADSHAKELKLEREMARKSAERWKVAAAMDDWRIMQRAMEIVSEIENGKRKMGGGA